MATPDDQVKKAAELKLWLETRIAELEEETERLKETLGLVDSTLRASNFKPASELLDEGREIPEMRELKRDKGGQVIAIASVTSKEVVVEPKQGVTLKSSTPPFKSFLMGKILQGMKTNDEKLVSSGKLNKGEELRYELREEDGTVRGLVIENYREKNRLNEILNTVAWTFSRMLEK
jgi:hypothetical protein